MFDYQFNNGTGVRFVCLFYSFFFAFFNSSFFLVNNFFLFADVGLRVGAETLPKSKVDNFLSFKRKLMCQFTTETVAKPD